MKEIDEKVRMHKHIIFAFDHYNTLGALRSLGEIGIHPIVILHGDNNYLVKHSKYLTTFHHVETIEEGYNLLIEKYGNEKLHPFIYSCDDFVESYLDKHYDELIGRFFFFDGGKNGIISQYMDKESISDLAVECGARVPKMEKLKRGVLPTTLNYPVITKSLMSIKGAWKNDVYICNNEAELMVEPIDFGFVVKGKVSFVKWWKDLKSCECLFFYNKHDKKPAISGWWHAISLHIKKKLHCII